LLDFITFALYSRFRSTTDIGIANNNRRLLSAPTANSCRGAHPEAPIDKRFDDPILARLPATRGAFLVGGSVRDLLRGRRPVDLDIAVAGDPEIYARAVAQAEGCRVVVMGRSGQQVYRVAARDTLIDVTALKNDRIDDDLRARDFTVNAMAWDLAAHRLIDPLAGQADLAAGRIRMVSRDAFASDPLRLLRAYRMAAVLGYAIAAETRATIRQQAALIVRPAGERIRVELMLLLAVADSARLVRQMADDALLTALFPEMQAMAGCRQNAHHDFDVLEHTLAAYDGLEAVLGAPGRLNARLADRYRDDGATTAAVLKYALLLHDIGKPATRRVAADGRVRFLGHAETSARMAAAINRRLRLSRLEALQAETVIRGHVRPLHLFTAHGRQALGLKAVNRFFRDTEPWGVEILLHALGDRRGKRRTPPPDDDGFSAFITGLLDYYFETYRPARSAAPLLNGRDLMRHFDLKPGPALGKLLAIVEEERLAGDLKTREAALDFVRRKLEG
jgi:putative nucleotidyltransferase with HDIG domain